MLDMWKWGKKKRENDEKAGDEAKWAFFGSVLTPQAALCSHYAAEFRAARRIF
ncbi:hypothetical protein [Burkholderia dolosa]|uniref:hypothetical protein n=1 Tax=Burkholderia dolosa TaxID=152500 RepID=UPI001C981DCB|nr:hypothetical protein [Burkholderia dolosa]MBY4828871.1 hypothetical protein [Burkholderia dolosa]